MGNKSDIDVLICEFLHIDIEDTDEDKDLREDFQADEDKIIEITQLIDDEYHTDLQNQIEDIFTAGDLYEFVSK